MNAILKNRDEDEIFLTNTSGTTISYYFGGDIKPLTETTEYDYVKNLPDDENIPRDVTQEERGSIDREEVYEQLKIPSQTLLRERWQREPFLNAFERFTRINRIVEFINDDAEFQLQSNPYLTEAVDRILEEVITIIKQKEIDMSYILEVFYDNEVKDWSTFRIVVKPRTAEAEIEKLLKVWDELSQKTMETLQLLSARNEIYYSKIEEVRDNLIISVEIE